MMDSTKTPEEQKLEEQTLAKQKIIRKQDNESYKGPAKTFTGNVVVQPILAPTEELNAGVAYVSFEAGARSHWHTHPKGQNLIVTEGTILTGVWGGKVYEANVGDAIVCPKGVKHWHGASPNAKATHLAITGEKDGVFVNWLEKVEDDQYNGK